MAITQTFENDLRKASESLEKQKEQGKNYFNIFEALGVSYKENYHSAFIAYLIDTNSEHYQHIFAELFLAKLKDEAIPNKVFGNLSVEKLQSVETEATTEKIKQNRRVDILLQFDNFVNIIIENKIYAKDQNAQIKDYVINISKNKDYTPNKTLVIYLRPDEKDPSEVSFGNGRGKWHLDKDGQYAVIRDNSGNMKAYYFQMTYKWIKSWIESCVKALEKQAKEKTRGENGLNKIIFGLNQYIEILEWYITNEWEENDPVVEFIMQNYKNQKMALEIMKDEKHDLHKVLKKSWDKINERIVENFYDDLLKEFKKGTKIGKDTYKAYRTASEIGKRGWQMVFYKKVREDFSFDYVIAFGYDKSKFAMPYFAYSDDTQDEQEKYEKILNECESFFKNNRNKNGVNKDRGCYYKYVFNEKDAQKCDFAEWIIKQDGNAVEKFKNELTEFIQLEVIQETMQQIEKYISENL